MLVADSFFSHRRLTPEDGEILALLARSIAHLSALKHTETALEEAYEAKAVLLSELRHRTKNSFALISSLLSIETARAKDPLLSETLRKLGDRVSVLTTLYDHLDASAGLGRIKLDEYLGRIAGDLIDGYDADGRGIHLERSLEPMEISMARAVPLGLIVNELVTDSLKHAFPGGRQGLVSLALRREVEGFAVLSVSDDGIGLPADFSVSGSKGLGITLVDTLCDQIQAELFVEQGPGASFRVRFPVEAPV
jgi:two-component sensor histidine kinase